MIAVLYGTTTGNTSDVAMKVQRMLGEDKVELFDVADIGLELVQHFDSLIFALPTWDYGEVQSDWEEVWHEVDDIDFTGKTVAFIGLGDQFAYGEWFLDAMGMLHDKVVARGATIIGHWPTDDYEFEASKAVTSDGQYFVGLAIDEDCQPELTDQRVGEWCTVVEQALTNPQKLDCEIPSPLMGEG